jgi:hypothetical protein
MNGISATQANLMNAASAMGIANAGILGSAQTFQPKRAERDRAPSNRTVFSGKIEVIKVANGYMVNIGRTEGYEFETFIATSVEEVNRIIMAQMVAFRLEE